MKREDFKEIKEIHIEVAKTIIENNGSCDKIQCDNCPFYCDNNTNEQPCYKEYTTSHIDTTEKDEKLLNSAKDFLKLFECDDIQQAMLINVEVGDKLWDYFYGWGKVIEIDKNSNYPILMCFKDNGTARYTFDGKYVKNQINPTLFWDEVKFEIPKRIFNIEKQLKRLVSKKFEIGKLNYYLIWNHTENKLALSFERTFEIPNMIYFQDANELRAVVDIINKNNITHERFLTAFNEIFLK